MGGAALPRWRCRTAALALRAGSWRAPYLHWCPMSTDSTSAGPTGLGAATTTLALKEWGAAVHALLEGRQTILLRKGGIHERRFEVARDRFVLFPTVAHSHAERVRPEHHDLLAPGEADVADERFTVRCGIALAGVVEVAGPERPSAPRPAHSADRAAEQVAERLAEIADLHIWTAESIQRDRVEFRPRLPLQVLVVRAFALPAPVVVERTEAYAGCKSWVDLPLAWPRGEGRQVHTEERLAADLARVRAALA